MINYFCTQHRDENGNHLDCDLCNNKGNCQSNVNGLVCPNTDIKLKKMGETISGGYIKFNSLPSNEKSKIMKTRSHQHFKKFVEEKKVHMNRQVDPNYNPPKTKK